MLTHHALKSITPLPAPAAWNSVATPLKILLVEDNRGDAELTRLSLDETDIPYTLVQLQKGSDVLPYLNHQDKSAPDLILLDLGLPGEDGFEIIADITAMGAAHAIPIAVLTGYEHFAYLKKSYEFCVTDYITKPCTTESLRKLMRRIAPH